MFRGTTLPGPYDEAISKATDENLTSEDWSAILEVCDRVSGDSNGSKEAVQSLIRRLAHRNANVQLYTLEVANALSQNCGKPMWRELSSRAFTEALLKLANDRNTHNQVKTKILERMKDWTTMFKSDPDLGIMYDAYYRLKQNNPSLQPPSAPQKNSLTDLDRQKEEEELQTALKLSLQEEERKKKAAEPGPSSGDGGRGSGSGPQAAAPLQPTPSGTTAATVSRVRALYDFVPSEPGELEFKKGEVITVLESVFKDWWRGSLKGKTGIFPLNYVEKLTDPTPEELQREAHMEAEVFAEIKNVEKLLTLLSASNTGPREEDNEEISKLYHQTLAIRPKLIKLIEKYSQKKDDFTQLNEKFIKARKDYEALLESSMSHPPAPNYHQYAMRPQVPQGYPQLGGPSYPSQPPPQQDHQQHPYYTPGQVQEQQQPHYPTSSPSPNFQRNNATPAPFYIAGAQISHGGHPPPNQPQQQHPPQPSSHPYPSYEQDQRLPSIGNQLAPIHTSSPPPQPGNQYNAYQAPNAANQRPSEPAGYGGAPQELSTSVYDSPTAPHPDRAPTYSSSVYSPDDAYTASPIVASEPPPAAQSNSSYQPYTPYHVSSPSPLQPPSGPPQPYNHVYDGGMDNSAPPQPTNVAPPQPIPQTRPGNVMTPPPLHPSGPSYDARQSLPSRNGRVVSPPPPIGGPGAGQQQPQYKAYIPPGGSAPGGPSEPGAGEAPSAPGDYYRTAAY